ncbi:MAG: alpha/beta hydrolase [Halomonadaceae bacterium]|nr:alpha/beta hydrolase [Halomonadaceae bacterium]
MKLIFSHGKESGPYGRKIITLAQIALSKGLHVQSFDYSDLRSPEARAERLLKVLVGSPEPHLLVGSSMGAYVSLVASQSVTVSGLFLLAPAVGLPGYVMQEGFELSDVPTSLIHGWQDEVVPVSNVMAFAQQHRADLHLLDSDHRLTNAMPQIGRLFADWLEQRL